MIAVIYSDSFGCQSECEVIQFVQNYLLFQLIIIRLNLLISTMPRRSNLSRRSNNARRATNDRANETPEQRANHNERIRADMALHRAQLSPEQQREQLEANRLRNQRERNVRSAEINANRRRRRRAANVNLFRCAFDYDCTIDFKELPAVSIGQMDVVCPHCSALKYPSETNGLCCAGGKVRLPELQPPPQPLYDLLYGLNVQLSNTFLKKSQTLNSSFQMTSFCANVIRESGGIYSFKVNSSNYSSNNNPYWISQGLRYSYNFASERTGSRPTLSSLWLFVS